jgi:streptogramin lyase
MTFLVVLVTAAALPLWGQQYVPYESFVYDKPLEQFIPVQAPYVPSDVRGLSLYQEGEGERLFTSLSSPEDLFVTPEGDIWVADTGNDRVLRMNDRGRVDLIVPELDNPSGVYVERLENGEQRVYVAETRASRILIMNAQGDILRTIGKPDDVRLENIRFRPLKVARDARGFFFIVLQGGSEGMLVLTPNGSFSSFFGANRVQLTPLQRIQYLFYTREQLERLVTRLAPSPSNVVIGSDRLIYMVTASANRGQLRKFNTAALDLYDRKEFPAYNPEGLSLVDLDVDASGNIFAVDGRTGMIYMYDNGGELMFSFGGRSETARTIRGLPRTAVAIDVGPEGRLFVLDSTSGAVHIYQPTEFADLVVEANRLFSDGRYSRSEELWKEVLDLNVNFQRAYLGLGMAYYNEEDYSRALEYFREALNEERFSMARFQLRLDWVQDYFGVMATTLTVVAVGYLVLQSRRERRRRRREATGGGSKQ